MINYVQKRDGSIVTYDRSKIEVAIKSAMKAVNVDLTSENYLTDQVEKVLLEINKAIPTVEEIQDIVETILIRENIPTVAKAYILYRKERKDRREKTEQPSLPNMFMNAGTLVEEYLNLTDWRVNENANMSYSLQGMNNHIVEEVTKQYWLSRIYNEEAKQAHQSGDIHIHDLGLLAPYCMGHDIEILLKEGFKGAGGKVESRPAKHFDSVLGQLVNMLFTLQGESAGAQAVSSIDTYLAPFIRYDALSYNEVRRCLEKFIFNMNIPTRVGFQTPFTNTTHDIIPHAMLRNMPVIIGGKTQKETYGEFQKEMDMFNKAFCEVMIEGDGAGRAFSFPIPTINVTPDFPWTSPVVQKWLELTSKFGTPYFANFINSDMSPEDVRSMCCRLRLDNRELVKRGGGLFGANPLTGSINVVTLNMARIGHLSTDVQDFKVRVKQLMDVAKEVCDSKRKILETYMDAGLYPYTRFYLKSVKEGTGKYFTNHFSTIGLNGMNEACIEMLATDLTTPQGINFAEDILDYMNSIIQDYQEVSGDLWNLEASPAEGATYRFARMDKRLYPSIVTQGKDEPYYTNSTQLPVDFEGDLFDAVELQSTLQSKYTGGTVFHGFLGEEIKDPKTAGQIIERVFTYTEIPYFTLTPTYSICKDHGHLVGEVWTCPVCGQETEVWSRVVGFHRPVQSWNKGKQEEFKERKEWDGEPTLSVTETPKAI